MEIIVVRHGETDWNKTQRIQGHQQIPLNEAGRSQAVKIAEWLSSIKLTHIYSSALIRSIETAEIINRSFSLPIARDARLNEKCYGVWEGKYSEEIFPPGSERLNYWLEENLDDNPNQGETTREMMNRSVGFLQDLTQTHVTSDIILVVTHGGPFKALTGFVQKWTPKDYFRTEIKNGQILNIFYQNSRFSVKP